MKPCLFPAAALGLLLLAQCKKSDPDPVSQLPPATLTGADTFGCLVNGQAWTPRGNNGFSNYVVDFDPTYNGGTVGLQTYRYDIDGKTFQAINFGGSGISQIGSYSLSSAVSSVNFMDTARPTGCQDYASRYVSLCQGSITVTRLDRAAGIVSGTFEFTLAKAGCDTIKVTQGRFDKKL